MVYLKKHLEKYPLMQIEDILKLYLQGILGVGHALDNYENVLKRINDEYQNINNQIQFNIYTAYSYPSRDQNCFPLGNYGIYRHHNSNHNIIFTLIHCIKYAHI